MKILILSDIHGNLTALRAVLHWTGLEGVKAVILLGDIIDYGPHSNEVVELFSELPYQIVCNVSGNHEHAILTENYLSFSSDRGRKCAACTRKRLNEKTWNYISNCMNPRGREEFQINDKKCLAIHGSLSDEYWKAIAPGDLRGDYREYDYVFSGHSHLPHLFAEYYSVDDPANRNKKKTVFLNPGSVGQPRNLNPHAQFALWDVETGEFRMMGVPYDVKEEQKAFSGDVDPFYSLRLERGI